MATFIDRMNTADALAKLYVQGQIAAVILRDTLKCMGFNRVVIGKYNIHVSFEGGTYRLMTDF